MLPDNDNNRMEPRKRRQGSILRMPGEAVVVREGGMQRSLSFRDQDINDVSSRRNRMDNFYARYMQTSTNASSYTDEESESRSANKQNFKTGTPIWKLLRPQLECRSRNSDTTTESASIQKNQQCSDFRRIIKQTCKKIEKSTSWNILVLIFTIILLLGGILPLFFRGTTQKILDPLFLITIAILIMDMFVASQTQHKYFCIRWKSWTDFSFGSFLFFYDFISVISLLVDISWVKRMIVTSDIEIQVENGEPRYNSNGPLHVNLMIMFGIVFRMARVARFLRIATVLSCSKATSTKIFTCLTKRPKAKLQTKANSSEKIPKETKVDETEAKTQIQDVLKEISHSDKYRKAAVIIQRYWRKYCSKESIKQNQAEELEKERKMNERIARLQKNYRRSSVTELVPIIPPTSMAKSAANRRRRRKKNSDIGRVMNEFTTKKVAYGTIIAIALTTLFTPFETDITNPFAMVALHNSMTNLRTNAIEEGDKNILFAEGAKIHLQNAEKSSNYDMVYYSFEDLTENPSGIFYFKFNEMQEPDFSENNEILTITVIGDDAKSIAYFDRFGAQQSLGGIGLLFLCFDIFVWFLGLLLFAGPVTTLVVIPIERMIRLLNMLVRDPLGYDSTENFYRFTSEEEEIVKYTCWTNRNLKGMETMFLMNTIIRIGSLMKVGYGAAGVEVIRASLRKNSKSSVTLRENQKAVTVSCIFMFCDIRRFTAASECLQEEVFLFTNKIAEVVHSVCHSLGGFAVKNVGDAFLMNWKLEEPRGEMLRADNKQADKALLSCVHICMALCNEEFFLNDISKDTRERLQDKFKKQKRNLVQLGFGLHAGKAVEGAIGSPRKLDATYLSNEVELAEFLESTTKKYGVDILMSGSFYQLLHHSNQRRCRQIDEVFFGDDSDEDETDFVEIPEEEGENYMRLYTFDFSLESLRELTKSAIEKLHQNKSKKEVSRESNEMNRSVFGRRSITNLNRSKTSNQNRKSTLIPAQNMELRRSTGARFPQTKSNSRFLHVFRQRESLSEIVRVRSSDISSSEKELKNKKEVFFQLPNGKVKYHSALWKDESIKAMRKKYNSSFYQRFVNGFICYQGGDWINARKEFELMVNCYQDKPSALLLSKMRATNFIPPRNFRLRLAKC